LYAQSSFEFEKASTWLQEHKALSWELALGYVLLLFVGERFMRSREPLKLQRPLIVWNLILAVFSIAGTVGILPEFIRSVKTMGFRQSFCKTNNFYDGENGFWVYMFVLSKVAELGDSFFLVLRKRRIPFLHWYHHASVLLFCWFMYPYKMAAVRWGVCLNFAVHSLMYVYYLLRALHFSIPGWISRSITSLQILQFVICVGITMDVLYRGSVCDVTRPVAVVQLALYVSYLGLFMNFFYNAYIKRGNKQHAE